MGQWWVWHKNSWHRLIHTSPTNKSAAQIERLTALKTMHEHGAEFDQTLTHLETVQNQLKDHVSSQGATLKVLEESMAKNMATIAGNVTDIEKRIEALTQKLAKLG